MPRPVLILAAFASGGLLTLMLWFNGAMAAATTPAFASLAAHATGTVAAGLVLALWPATRGAGVLARAPAWAYLGGLSGALTVIVTAVAVNSPLALTGTLALGLAGQVLFGLFADARGLFGLPRRRPDLRDAVSVALIAGGSLLILTWGAA